MGWASGAPVEKFSGGPLTRSADGDAVSGQSRRRRREAARAFAVLISRYRPLGAVMLVTRSVSARPEDADRKQRVGEGLVVQLGATGGAPLVGQLVVTGSRVLPT